MENVLSSNKQLLYHSLWEAWMNMKMSLFPLVVFLILKNYNLGLKTVQNYSAQFLVVLCTWQTVHILFSRQSTA